MRLKFVNAHMNHRGLKVLSRWYGRHTKLRAFGVQAGPYFINVQWFPRGDKLVD